MRVAQQRRINRCVGGEKMGGCIGDLPWKSREQDECIESCYAAAASHTATRLHGRGRKIASATAWYRR